MLVQLPADSLPVFMKEPSLSGTPLVAKDSPAAADCVTYIPASITPVMVCTVLNCLLVALV